MDRKTFLCIFSRWFSVRFREITYAKNIGETKVFFFVSPLTKEQQRKQLVNLTFVAYVITRKRRENQRKKNIEKCFPSINL